MPDTYITIPDENGTINISEDVIAAIAGAAVSEVEGIAAFTNISGPELSELIGKKSVTRGIRAGFDEEGVVIDITVSVRFGVNITAIGEKAQRAAAQAVESMTGLKPVVNVHVSGVSFDK